MKNIYESPGIAFVVVPVHDTFNNGSGYGTTPDDTPIIDW